MKVSLQSSTHTHPSSWRTAIIPLHLFPVQEKSVSQSTEETQRGDAVQLIKALQFLRLKLLDRGFWEEKNFETLDKRLK